MLEAPPTGSHDPIREQARFAAARPDMTDRWGRCDLVQDDKTSLSMLHTITAVSVAAVGGLGMHLISACIG
jgi:hypothetical protein